MRRGFDTLKIVMPEYRVQIPNGMWYTVDAACKREAQQNIYLYVKRHKPTTPMPETPDELKVREVE